MDKSALCQDYAANPSSGWGPVASEQAHRGSLSCIELNMYYVAPRQGVSGMQH